MRELKFGIIGAGGIAHQFVDAVRRVEGACIVAVSSKSLERAEGFAKSEQIPAAYGDYAQMLREAKPDAVYVATTHNFHYENVKLCLEQGVHVLCEKPFVLNSKDAKELFALAKEKGLLLMEAMWSRYLPQTRKVRQWLADGEIGTVRLASGVVGFKGAKDANNRVFSPKLAGGAVYDIGVYAIELMTYFIDQKLKDVKVQMVPAWTGVDASNLVAMRFEHCTAALQTTVMASPLQHITLNGEDGYIFIPSSNVGNEAFLYKNGKLVEHFKEEYQNGFVWEVQDFVACVNEGKLDSDVIPSSDSILCAQIFDLANEALTRALQED